MQMSIENPFTNAELNDIFKKQKEKIPFKIIKNVKDECGKEYELSINGRFIPTDYYDIWQDDYIVGFDKSYATGGRGYANNRFETFDELKNEIFSAFDLVECLQTTLF